VGVAVGSSVVWTSGLHDASNSQCPPMAAINDAYVSPTVPRRAIHTGPKVVLSHARVKPVIHLRMPTIIGIPNNFHQNRKS
jgi:hypothetical protein